MLFLCNSCGGDTLSVSLSDLRLQSSRAVLRHTRPAFLALVIVRASKNLQACKFLRDAQSAPNCAPLPQKIVYFVQLGIFKKNRAFALSPYLTAQTESLSVLKMKLPPDLVGHASAPTKKSNELICFAVLRRPRNAAMRVIEAASKIGFRVLCGVSPPHGEPTEKEFGVCFWI